MVISDVPSAIGKLVEISSVTPRSLAVWITFFGAQVYSYLPFIISLSLLDFIAHYHIDWCKMNYGNRDITTPAFWNHLGLDQMAHQVTYLLIAYLVII